MSNMTCATCGKENEWERCKRCGGAGTVYWDYAEYDPNSDRTFKATAHDRCPDCKGEGGKWVCACDKAAK